MEWFRPWERGEISNLGSSVYKYYTSTNTRTHDPCIKLVWCRSSSKPKGHGECPQTSCFDGPPTRIGSRKGASFTSRLYGVEEIASLKRNSGVFHVWAMVWLQQCSWRGWDWMMEWLCYCCCDWLWLCKEALTAFHSTVRLVNRFAWGPARIWFKWVLRSTQSTTLPCFRRMVAWSLATLTIWPALNDVQMPWSGL